MTDRRAEGTRPSLFCALDQQLSQLTGIRAARLGAQNDAPDCNDRLKVLDNVMCIHSSPYMHPLYVPQGGRGMDADGCGVADTSIELEELQRPGANQSLSVPWRYILKRRQHTYLHDLSDVSLVHYAVTWAQLSDQRGQAPAHTWARQTDHRG